MIEVKCGSCQVSFLTIIQIIICFLSKLIIDPLENFLVFKYLIIIVFVNLFSFASTNSSCRLFWIGIIMFQDECVYLKITSSIITIN